VVGIVSVVQQFMTEFKDGCVRREEIVAITKIILNFMKQNDHYNSYAETTKDRT
jgi:hypothetical protein